ncbi:MAG: hypothetical protein R3290_05315, partial [Acidimicrobiia bacterium]|nr:hypothetical protein [Acidimicrobiia bacterium]
LIRWRQGRCLPYGEGVTFWALGEVVKAEAGILETDTPATAHGKLAVSLEQLAVDATDRAWITDRLAPLVGSAAGATADRSEQFAAWTAYLVALADQRPTVLVVEDLHWADPALVEFLSQLPQAARHVPLLLAATARPGFFDEHTAWGAGQRNALTIRLEALDPSSTRSLIDDLLAGEDVDDSTRAAVAERSGGNPLYAQEFARMVRDRRDEGADATVPDTVQAIVTARLDLLDPGAKAAVQAAAVVGKSFWSGAVQAVLEDEVDVETILGEVARRELVRRERTSTMAGETEYTFTHSVVRDVAYGLAPRAVRSRRHHRAARWIEGMAGDRVADRAELVAHHDAEALRLARAADVPEREDYGSIAAESHIRAADQARHLDVESQRSHLEAALELVDPLDPRRARLLADLGGALFASGPGDLAVKTLMEAREEAERVGEIETWGETSLRLSRALWVGGDPDTSDRTIDEVIERLEADAPTSTALASAYAQRAVGLWISGRPDEALAYIELVRPHVQAHGESFARSRLLSAEGGSRFDAGDPAAVERFRQALRMAVEQGDAVDISSTHLNLAEQLLTGWGPDEAEPVARRGLELAQKRGISGVATFLQGHLATSTFLQGRWDETLDLVEGARGSASAYIVGLFEGTELAIHVSRGVEPPRLAAAVAELVSEAEELRDLQAVVPTHVFAAFILAPAGHTEQALHHAREVVARAAGTRYLLDGLAMPLHLMRAGGELDAFEHLLPDLRRFDMPRPAAQVRLIEGLVAERDDPRAAIDAAREAAEELASLRANLDALFALAEAHRIAGAVGDEGARGDARRRANEVFGQAGAVRLFEFLGLAS